jgi:Cytochrome b(C-terminal)/b6/petD
MDFIKGIFNVLADPRLYFFLMVLFLVFMVWKREVFTSKAVGYGVLGFLTLFFALGGLDPNFQLIITKPDNVPIVGLIFLLVFFTWYSMREAVLNDRRIAKGDGPIEKAESDRVWVWPDLVYTELISLILCSVVLIVWSILLKAPLEQPANRAVTPNPSKAPWYFLGLQEMLVYFDPWLAGVVLPSLIIVGLIAIPYIDKNPKGNGYFTFAERKVEITLFLFGFVILWSSLIVLGTFLRGPNWNFFGPFEYWDTHKLEALTNVNLSEYFWVRMLGGGLPTNYFIRELPGIILCLIYVAVLPPLLAKRGFKTYYDKLGGPRFYVTVFLFLMMMALPIKMLLRWIFNLKYIIGIPEIFFNI